MNHAIFIWLIDAFWLIFVTYWIVSAFGVKKDMKKNVWKRVGILLISIVAYVSLPICLKFFPHFSPPLNPVINSFGVIICAAGIAFTLWARWHLGRNWSATPSIK
jgi:protein-S-isoprenylcysteine O-methyltransferase Ste14